MRSFAVLSVAFIAAAVAPQHPTELKPDLTQTSLVKGAASVISKVG